MTPRVLIVTYSPDVSARPDQHGQHRVTDRWVLSRSVIYDGSCRRNYYYTWSTVCRVIDAHEGTVKFRVARKRKKAA